MNVYKKWFRNFILLLMICIVMVAVLTVLVDPYFHYHAPIAKYKLSNPRYTNDGISRHFDFDAVIIGTSMSQNFKCSEYDALFGTKSVKMPYEGAGYRELSLAIDRTLERNKEVKRVLWVVDYNGLLRDADWTQYDSYPEYLYDNNYFNDLPYLLNKDIFLRAVLPDILLNVRGKESTDMDEYSAWKTETGEKVVYLGRRGIKKESEAFSDEDKRRVENSIQENILNVISKYPDVHFDLYFTPYSIYNWEALGAAGDIERYIGAQKRASELMLQYDNISLYSFFEHTEIITDLNYYRDEAHYDDRVSSMILGWIANGEGLVTKDNLEERISAQRKYFEEFDYDSYFTNIEVNRE